MQEKRARTTGDALEALGLEDLGPGLGLAGGDSDVGERLGHCGVCCLLRLGEIINKHNVRIDANGLRAAVGRQSACMAEMRPG